MHNTFTRVTNGVATEHYITSIKDNTIYYGHYIAGHENKRPTACMTLEYFNRLAQMERYKNTYILGGVI